MKLTKVRKPSRAELLGRLVEVGAGLNDYRLGLVIDHAAMTLKTQRPKSRR